MNKYVLADFEGEFVETNDQVLRVRCNTLDEEYYDMLCEQIKNLNVSIPIEPKSSMEKK